MPLDGGGDVSATRSLRGAAERDEEVRSARCASRACGCTAKEDEHAVARRTSPRGRMLTSAAPAAPNSLSWGLINEPHSNEVGIELETATVAGQP